MQDNGLDFDQISGDQVYTISLDPVPVESRINYQVTVNDTDGAGEYREPCQPDLIHAFENSDPDLVINEFMAGNDVTFAEFFID